MINGRAITSAKDDQKMYQLQEKLLQVWSKNNVEDFYQNIFLAHLDTLPLPQAQELIIQQIKQIKQGKSCYFKLARSQKQRKKSLKKLQILLDDQQFKNTVDQEAMSKICQQIHTLRDSNLGFTQTLMKISRQLAANEYQISDECTQMLNTLDQDNSFVKESFLKNYILFKKGYDPFFLNHYEMKGYSNPKYHHPLIDQLFTLSLGYACRFFNAQKELIDVLANQKISPKGEEREEEKNVKPMVKTRRRKFQFIKETPEKLNKRYEDEGSANKVKSKSSIFRKKKLSLARDEDHEEFSFSKNSKSKFINQSQDSSKMSSISNTRKDDINLPSISLFKTAGLVEEKEKKQKKLKEEASEKYFSPQKNRFSNRHSETDSLNTLQEEQLIDSISKKQSHKRSLHPLYRKRKNKKESPSRMENNFITESSPQKNFSLSSSSSFKYERMNTDPQRFHTITANASEEDISKRSIKLQESAFKNKSPELTPITRFSPQKHDKFAFSKEQNASVPHERSPLNLRLSLKKAYDSRAFHTISHESSIPQEEQKQEQQLPKQTLIPDNIFKNKPLKKRQSKRTITPIDLSNLRHPIKMKPGSYTFQQLIHLLRNTKFQKHIEEIIQNKKWEESLKKFQTYIIQFTINDDMVLLSITLLLPDGNYLLKLWGQLENCPQDLSLPLFRKYLNYLEKITTLDRLFYNGPEILEIKENNFVMQKANSYYRLRKGAQSQKKDQFLTLKCSNIVLSQQNPSTKLFFSEQIQKFSKNTSFCLPSFSRIDRKSINQNLLMLVKINQNITNMQTLNTLLEDENFDTFQIVKNMKVSDIKALRLSLNTAFKSPFIDTGSGFLTFQGSLVSAMDNQVTCLLACSNYNTRIYFGSGFSSAKKFISSIKIDNLENCQFSVRKFSKQLYGKIYNKSPLQNSYGYWQVDFGYEHELPGKTKHTSNTSISFGFEEFYVAIQIESQIVYGFKVVEQDFVE